MNRTFPILALIVAAMFAYAPVMILQAPYESTMGLVQKIFYFHVPSAIAMFAAAFTCGIASAFYLFRGRPDNDRVALAAAELTVLFGVIVLISGPLWARKAWGVWWDWDARLTSTFILWLIFNAYLLLRRYGGPGSDRLAAGIALFGMVNVPFIYVSVNYWRTMHPKTTVLGSLVPPMAAPVWFGMFGFALMAIVLFTLRVQLEEQRARVEALYLAADES